MNGEGILVGSKEKRKEKEFNAFLILMSHLHGGLWNEDNFLKLPETCVKLMRTTRTGPCTF
jgi:hypothetical protein